MLRNESVLGIELKMGDEAYAKAKEGRKEWERETRREGGDMTTRNLLRKSDMRCC